MVETRPAPEVPGVGGAGGSGRPGRGAVAALVAVALMVAAAVWAFGGDGSDRIESADGSDDLSAERDASEVVDAAGQLLFPLAGGVTPDLGIDPWLGETVIDEMLLMPSLGDTVEERQRVIDAGGLTIELGLDPDVSVLVADVLDELPPELDAAAVTVDNASGQIVSAVSRSSESLGLSKPAGSARLVLYAAALQGGLTQDDPIDGRGPCADGDGTTVENFGGNPGSVGTLRQQVLLSSLCALVRLQADLEPGLLGSIANRLGIPDAPPETFVLPPRLTAAEHVRMIAAVANGGAMAHVGLVKRILGTDGAVLFERSDAVDDVLTPNVAADLLDILEANVRGGTGTRAQLEGSTAAGLTGTSPDFTAAWFVGTSDGFSTALWVALPSGEPMTDIAGLSVVTGGSFPAEAWGQIYQQLVPTSTSSPDRTIEIEALGERWPLYDGVDEETLRRGPARYPGTAQPGEAGNVAIAGHRTTWGAPFLRLDELEVGDLIVIEAGGTRHEYRVIPQADGAPHRIVEPDQIDVIEDTDTALVTLTTHHPRFSARQRLIVQAELVGDPTGSSSADPDATAALDGLP